MIEQIFRSICGSVPTARHQRAAVEINHHRQWLLDDLGCIDVQVQTIFLSEHFIRVDVVDLNTERRVFVRLENINERLFDDWWL